MRRQDTERVSHLVRHGGRERAELREPLRALRLLLLNSEHLRELHRVRSVSKKTPRDRLLNLLPEGLERERSHRQQEKRSKPILTDERLLGHEREDAEQISRRE